MPVVLSLAIREMNLTPAQALYAATIGGAKALKRDELGHLTVGAKADFVIWDAPSHLHIPYRMGEIPREVFN
jgi:imidazolonepropionase